MVGCVGCGARTEKMLQRIITHREMERQKNVDALNAFIKDGGQIDLEVQIQEEEIEKLKRLCDEQGIKYHHKAGIKKLTELLDE